MEIKPYSQNAKKHPKSQLIALAKIVKEVGWRQPVLVNQKGIIVAGHGRYSTWQNYKEEYGLKDVWVIDDKGKTIFGEPESNPLTEQQEIAYRLADNKLNESDWDMKLVTEDLKLLSLPMVDLTGFDKDLLIEADEDDDIVPETPIEPKSKLGDLYELGQHRVLCGDSTQLDAVSRLMDGKKADMVFTDMPYGIDKEGIMNDGLKGKDFEDFNDKYIRILPVKENAGFICYHSTRTFNPTINMAERNGWKFEKIFFMHRPDKFPVHTWNGWMMTSQAILLFTKGKAEYYAIHPAHQDVYRITSKDLTESKVDHPTVKPVAHCIDVMKHFIANSVFEPFLGSGSTLIACEKTGRICYGMELDPKYVDVTVQRYVDYTGNTKIKKNGKIITWEESQKTKEEDQQ